jgi:hypothetical protein
MVLKEIYATRKDGVVLYKSYSDKGVYIKKVGTNEEYDVAIDVENATYKYVETNTPIEKEEENNQ